MMGNKSVPESELFYEFSLETPCSFGSLAALHRPVCRP